jgi:hypothetical protein
MKITLAFLTVLLLFPLAGQAAPVGTFTHVEGRVDITSPAQAARPAHIGDDVSTGDIIRTKSGSKAEITFTDNTILRLAQKSRVEITEYLVGTQKTTVIIFLYRGKIRHTVEKALGRLFGPKKRSRFEVHSPIFAVGIRGTDFFTYYQRELRGAIFTEGRGYGYSLNRPDVVRDIRAGQAMVVVSPDIPPVIRPATGVEIQKHMKDTTPSEKPQEESEPTAKEVLPEPDVGSPEELASTEQTVPELPAPIPPETTVNVQPEIAPVIPITETRPDILKTRIDVHLEWGNNR